MRTRLASRLVNGRFIGEDAIIVYAGRTEYNQWGEPYQDKPTRIPVKVSSAPVPSTELETMRNILPEGSRVKEARKFLLTSDISPIRINNLRSNSDKIVYNNVIYTVLSAADWTPDGSFEVMAYRQET